MIKLVPSYDPHAWNRHFAILPKLCGSRNGIVVVFWDYFEQRLDPDDSCQMDFQRRLPGHDCEPYTVRVGYDI